jgi:hypothetical protein
VNIIFVVTVLSALLLTGCAAEWSRPNTTLAEYNAGRRECGQEAWRQYPENWGRGSGQNYEAARRDKNEVPRIRAYETCMTAKGYTLTGQRTAI